MREALRWLGLFLIFNPCFAIALALCVGLALFYDSARPAYPLAKGSPAEVIAWVSAPVQQAGDLDYLEVTPLEIRQFGRRLPPYPGRIAVYVTRTASGGAGRLLYSDIVRFETLLEEPTYYETPGTVDYREYLWRQGILHVARFKSPLQLEVRGAAPYHRWMRPLFRYARAFERYCFSHLTRTQAQFVLSLFLGRGKALNEIDVEDLKRLGILHIFVVSGSHVSLLLICLHFLFRRFGGAGTLVTLAGVWGYIAMVGCSAPVLRSGIMATSLYLLISAGLGQRLMNALGLSAALLLAWSPPSLSSSSFQLSYLSLCAIGLLVVPVRAQVSRTLNGVRFAFSDRVSVVRSNDAVRQRRARYLAERLLTLAPRRWGMRVASWSASGAQYLSDVTLCSALVPMLLLPVCLYYSNLWVWSQALSNVLLIPLFGIAVPLCLLLFLFFWTPLAGIVSRLVAGYADLLMGLTDRMARFAWLEYVTQPSVGLALAYLVIFPACCLLLKGRRKAFALLAPGLLYVILVVPPFGAGPTRFSITMLDVGQSESIHLRYPDGADALVDTGGSLLAIGPNRQFIGERVISRYLWSEGRRRLRYVMLTHSHADHTGGYPFIQRAFPVTMLFYGRWDEQYRGTTSWQMRAGQRLWISGVDHYILSPSPAAEADTPNNESLVVCLKYGRFSALLTGDAEERVESEISPFVRPVTVFKVGHHGGRHSNSLEILQAARPTLALISVGRKNPFGHPSPRTLERLRRLKIPWLSTATHGTIRIETDGVNWEVSRYSKKKGGFEKVTQFCGELPP